VEKETRNAIQRATQDARSLLEGEFGQQLEGVFDVRLDGTIASAPGGHLAPAERLLREKLVAAVEHRLAGGLTNAQAVASYLREAAFTTLNRFVALKMLEARGLVQECVSRGEESTGFREYMGLAPGLVQLPDRGYRLYLESLFDEVGREVGILFDRRDPSGFLWPRRQALAELLATLNEPRLAGTWDEDETIGWVYQYFNSDKDRERARYDAAGKPKAPQNGYELAVRNQFFTPRYVVRFLTDNTLGRTWFQMRNGQTALADACEFLVQNEDAAAPREQKDPRDLRILDPACGSGHFLLYAFDLLLRIYEEAWEDAKSPTCTSTGRRLRDDYPEVEGLQRALPALILRHNLYGVEIDPRAAQTAALALWLRAQRAYRTYAVPPRERGTIKRTHIVVAEPMPGDKSLAEEFAAVLEPPLLADLFVRMVEEMQLAGELGPLLRVNEALAAALGDATLGVATLVLGSSHSHSCTWKRPPRCTDNSNDDSANVEPSRPTFRSRAFVQQPDLKERRFARL